MRNAIVGLDTPGSEQPLPWIPGRGRAQGAFEFVLILPLFFLLLLLLVDFGVLMFEYVSVANAAREGARFGSVNCSTGTCTAALVQSHVEQDSGGLLSTPSEITVEWIDRNGNGSGNDRGDSVVVSISHPYNFLFFYKPSPYNPGGFSIPVVACADMSLEQADGGTSLPSGSGCL